MSKIVPIPGKGAAPGPAPELSSVAEIVAELRAGRMVVIMDDEDRENEGDLIMAAEHATPESRGVHDPPHQRHHLRARWRRSSSTRLELPQMVPVNSESHRTAFTVSVDLRAGTTTGVSSADRAATIRALADPASAAGDFARPGHIFPLRSRARRRAGARRPHRGGGRSVPARRAEAGRRAVRGHERRRQHGAPPAARGVRAAHELKIGTDRRPHPPSAAQRALGRAHLRAERADRARRVPPVRLRGSRQPAMCIWRWRTAGSTDRKRRWCACTSPTRCATCSACAATRAPGRCAPRCSASPTPATAWSWCCASRNRRASWPTPCACFGAPRTRRRPQGDSRGEGEVLRTFGVGAQILKDLGVRRMRVLSAPKQMHGISAFGLEIEGYVGEDGDELTPRTHRRASRRPPRGRSVAIVAARFNDFIVVEPD